MSRNHRNIEDLLRQSRPPEVPQMATALGRVLNRLSADHSAETDAPMVDWDGPRRTRSFRPVLAAAALVIVAVGGAMIWPRGVQAYTAGADGLQVTLSDDSRVEMRAHAEMTVADESDGIQIDLKTGDIIVTAADQRDRHLLVRTKDMTVAVNGTALLVNAGQDGSRVGVIEGEARVREAKGEKRLRPGEQLATSPLLVARPVRDDIIWSRHATVHQAVIDTFMKGVAQTTSWLAPLVRQADVAGAQTPGAQAAALEFEEASIRPCDPDNLPAAVGGRGGGGPNAVYMTPGRFYALCMTPATLIRTAYGYRSWDQEVDLWFMDDIVPGGRTFSRLPTGTVSNMGIDGEDGRRVRGGPDWMRTERYTIEAVARVGDGQDACLPLGGRAGQPPRPSPPGVCYSANAASMSGPMLRALLERRFGLKAHIETEQTPAYTLVVAPGGLKMKEGACIDPSAPPQGPGPAPPGTRPIISEAERARQFMERVRRNLDAARRGDATTGSCGPGIADNGPNRIFVSAGAGLPPLQGILEAPVTDRTGIPNTTRFNYALEFLVEERTKTNPYGAIASPLLQMADNPSSVQPAPNLFNAVEQQLGLRLVPEQVRREYIVIDAIRRLDPN